MAETESTTSYWHPLERVPVAVAGMRYELPELQRFAVQNYLRKAMQGKERNLDDEADISRSLGEEIFAGRSAREAIVLCLDVCTGVSDLVDNLILNRSIVAGREIVTKKVSSEEYDRIIAAMNLLFGSLSSYLAMRIADDPSIDTDYIVHLMDLANRIGASDPRSINVSIFFFQNKIEHLANLLVIYKRFGSVAARIRELLPDFDFNAHSDELRTAGNEVWQTVLRDFAYDIPSCFFSSETLPQGRFYHVVPRIDLAAVSPSLAGQTDHFLCHVGVGPKPAGYVRAKVSRAHEGSDTMVALMNKGVNIHFAENTAPSFSVDLHGNLRHFMGSMLLEEYFALRGQPGMYQFLRLAFLDIMHELTEAPIPVERQRAVRSRRPKDEGITQAIVSAQGDRQLILDNLRTLLVPRTEVVSPRQRSIEPVAVNVRRREGGRTRVYRYNVYPRYLPEGYERSKEKTERIAALNLDGKELAPQFKQRGVDFTDPRWTIAEFERTLEATDTALMVVRRRR